MEKHRGERVERGKGEVSFSTISHEWRGQLSIIIMTTTQRESTHDDDLRVECSTSVLLSFLTPFPFLSFTILNRYAKGDRYSQDRHGNRMGKRID